MSEELDNGNMSELPSRIDMTGLPREVDIRSIIESAVSEATATAAAEATRIAKESMQKTSIDAQVEQLKSYDVSGNKIELQPRLFDGYLESRKTVMTLEQNPKKITAARIFDDVDDFWGGPKSIIYPPFWPAIRVVPPIGDPPQYEIAINHGYIIQSFFESESGTDKLQYFKPTNLEQWQTLTPGLYFYIKVQRDGSGMIKASPAPSLIVSNAILQTQSYSRKFGETGEVEGIYHYLICKSLPPLIAGGPPQIERYCAGDNIFVVQERPEMINLPIIRYPEVGEDYRDIAKNYDENKDAQQLRSIRQLGPDKGLPIIKPFGVSEDPITVETIDFRRIAERDMGSTSGEAQIKIVLSEDGRIIHVQGNAFEAEKSWITVKDGLVTQLGDPEYAGTGSLVSKGYEEGTPTIHIEWEDGFVKTDGTITIKDKDDQPQVKVKSAAGTITIEGNGYNASAGGITVEDGLVTYLDPTGGGCEDGGTGSISLIEEGASTGVPIAEWIDGCVKTNGDVQIVVREIEVCIDGVATPVKFLTIDAMPTPPPPPTP